MIGDSYELLFQIKANGQAALDQIEAAERRVEAAGKGASAAVDSIGASAASASGGVTAFSASADKAAESIRRIGEASHGTVSEVQAASASLRTLEGAMPIRAAERFLTNILGMGPALQAAFPLIGAAAFAEMLAKVTDEIVDYAFGLKKAEKAAESAFDAAHKALVEMDKLLDRAAATDRKTLGIGSPTAEGVADAAEIRKRVSDDRTAIAALKKEISDLQAQRAGALRPPGSEDLYGPAPNSKLADQLSGVISEKQSSLIEREARLRADAADLRYRQAETENRADQADSKNALNLFPGFASIFGVKTNDPLEALREEIQNSIKEDQKRQEELDKLFAEADKFYIEQIEAGQKSGREDIRSLDESNPLKEGLKQGKQRFEIADHELAAYEKIISLGRDEYGQAREIRDLRLATAKDVVAAAQAELDYQVKIAELQKKQIDEARAEAGHFYDALKGGPNGIRNFFVGQADTLGRQVASNALGPVFQSVNKSLGIVPHDTLHGIFNGTVLDKGNASPEITSRDKNTAAVDHLTEVIRSTLNYSGGPGVTGIDDLPLSSGGMSAIDRIPGLGTFGSDTNGWTGSAGGGILGKIFGKGSATSDFTGGLGRFLQPGQGYGALLDAITGNSGDSGSQRAGVLAGGALSLATGGLAIAQGISQGGARGITGAVGAGLGTDGALAGGFSNPVGATLEIAGIAAGLVKSLFGDPKQQRDEEITRMLRNQQYLSPPTINRTTDAAGNEVGYDFMGHARSLPFSTFSEVMPYSKRFHIPGQPGFWGNVPGQIIEPYDPLSNYNKDFSLPGGIPQGGNPPPIVIQLTVHANDVQSFQDALLRNSATVAGATAKEIKLGHHIGLAIQQAVLGT